MRRPETRDGRCKMVYLQVPYDDRYYVLYKDKQEVARLPHRERNLAFAFWTAMLQRLNDDHYHPNTEKFKNKVEQYNDYLDNLDDMNYTLSTLRPK